MSATSSRKKIKEMPIDRLSALPDGILCNILSFLEMKEAAITSLLSKRWQFLWTQLPSLRFEEGCDKKMKEISLQFEEGCCKKMEEISKFVSRVHRTLAVCRRDNLERFEVDFICHYSGCFAFDVNAWIGFAVENKVKAFSLLLSGCHVLPRTMYSNPSWITLSIRGCNMAPRGTIQWQSLTTLRMHVVKLDENAFEKIFSGCPVLSSLDLVWCRGFNRLEVNSLSLRTLAIECNGDDLQISAPYIHNLKIVSRMGCTMLRLENIKSLIQAEVETDSENCVKQLLGSIRHVKMLKLGGGCIELLSSIAPSWQPSQSTRKCLELHVMPGDDESIPGIFAILKSSPNLETLIIHGDYFSWDNVPSNPTSKDDLDCDLFHLKTVHFKNCENCYSNVGEPMLTLARILLKRAVVLETMVVDFSGFRAPPSITAFDKITQKLLIYSRFSQKTVVLFSKELSSSVNGHLLWP